MMCNKVRCVSLARNDSFAGANFRARTALDAFVGIDVVDVAFRNCFNGANGEAGAASNAFVSDYVSHSFVRFLDVITNEYDAKVRVFL